MRNFKLIIAGQTITVLIYTIIYLCISFIIWDFRNPFYWIFNIGNLNPGDRATILFFIVFYYFVLYTLIYEQRNFILTKFFK